MRGVRVLFSVQLKWCLCSNEVLEHSVWCEMCNSGTKCAAAAAHRAQSPHELLLRPGQRVDLTCLRLFALDLFLAAIKFGRIQL